MNRRRIVVVACIALASLSIGGGASAQFPPAIELPPDLPTVMPAMPPGSYPPTVAPTAAASYFAPPAWSQTLAPNVRFVILSNFNNDAVLDRETGLVWTRRNVAAEVTGEAAAILCRRLGIGNRMGWRLPVVAELQSLVDLSVPASPPAPRLSVGHPFMLSSTFYWANEAYLFAPGIVFQRQVSLAVGNSADQDDRAPSSSGVLCVRGLEVQAHTNLR